MQNNVFYTDFCLQIAKRVGLERIEEGLNFVFSPISIHASLSLIAAGSTGKTLDQLLSFLNSKTIYDLNEGSLRLLKLMLPHSNGGPVLSFANGVWVHKSFPLKPSFREIIFGMYGAEAKNLDFENKADQATTEVNSWVNNATNGLIKDILPLGSIDNSTALVLANALYFKGVWDRRYDPSQTRDSVFHLLNGDTIQVPFMTSKKRERHFFQCIDGFKLLKLPYQNGLDNRQFFMYFFLPEQKNGLKTLMEKLNSIVGFFNQDFDLGQYDIDIFGIPRFEISFGFEASNTIKELGLVFPFIDVGELSEMVASAQGLCLSNIFHSSCVEVNEEGTEVAASTISRFIMCSGRLSPLTFVADHPFMFMVREEASRMVLFIGAVLNPSSVS